ncbi:tRNA adenosine(34) deaminase TadA [Alcanivorax marinus]|uniref:tRNA-specific adenosine deaminase n=1 Tax=Alloalcanivorax marinus TaxID=1177169 RepID=A0A9Q3YLT4_9GAMM|nr:tRNA adenosine(34) deaminase TadA [Alloalcanivorax marinus]MCC4308084.1 tRNA adenosine(34) deaminase TadA [Alloalcanivorax marinus]
MQDDEYWMDRALALAERAGDEGEVPVGALVVRDGQLLGEGWNRPIGAHDPTGHAEVNALRDAAARQGNYRLPGATLYVTIEPCTMCFGALMHARIARLVYGAREPRAGVCESQLGLPERTFYNHRVEVVSGVAAERAAGLLRDFFRERRVRDADRGPDRG